MTTMNPIEARIRSREWHLPPGVRAASTTRAGGASEGNWASLNLARHVQDDPVHVEANRERLVRALGLPGEPVWLNQVHAAQVAILKGGEKEPAADAAFTRVPGVVCAIMTADCLPVLFADQSGGAVAAAHAGWRGLAGGVLEATLECFDDPTRLTAWLGPAIGPTAFQVGDEVREVFIAHDSAAQDAFKPDGAGHWLADIYQLARQRLSAMGVTRIQGGGRCTFSEPERYFSYRRDRKTGRMASLIWIEEETANE